MSLESCPSRKCLRSVWIANKIYENIRKVATGQEDLCMTGYLLDYPYFKENYKIIEKDLSKQQAPDADSSATQQKFFTGNLDCAGNTTLFSLLKKQKKLFWTFHKEL